MKIFSNISKGIGLAIKYGGVIIAVITALKVLNDELAKLENDGDTNKD